MAFVVGKTYVVGSFRTNGEFIPTQCNGRANEAHPCRVVLRAVTKTYVWAFMTGDKKNPTKCRHEAFHELDVAKAGYRLSLENRDRMWTEQGATCMLGPAKINQLVEAL